MIHCFYYYLQKIITIILHKVSSYGKVFMFHKIRDIDCDNYTVNINNFEKIIYDCTDNDYIFSSLDEIEKMNPKSIYITFDDCYEDVFINAYPILKKNNVPFCCFISLELLDKPGYLSTQQLIELSKDDLCTIGSHCSKHLSMRKQKDSAELIKKSKKELENIINKEVKYLAYPYGTLGDVSLKNIRQAKSSGYLFAFSTIQTEIKKFFIKSNLYRYVIPRININNNFKG